MESVINLIQVCRTVQLRLVARLCFLCAFYVVSAPLIPSGDGAAAAQSRAVQYARLWSATL